jgi:hypothetical protein
MGHSVRRPIKYSADEQPRLVTKLELLPEEALYLVERGSMLCFKQDANSDLQHFDTEDNSFAGNPMTVQQAFAEMIGRESHHLARYQVGPLVTTFAYLGPSHTKFSVLRLPQATRVHCHPSNPPSLYPFLPDSSALFPDRNKANHVVRSSTIMVGIAFAELDALHTPIAKVPSYHWFSLGVGRKLRLP